MNYSNYRTKNTNQNRKNMPYAVAATLVVVTAILVGGSGAAHATTGVASRSTTQRSAQVTSVSAIQQRYNSDAHFRQVLGSPIGPEHQGEDTLVYQNYQNGRAYSKAGFGVHEVHGSNYTLFTQYGADQGVGIPVTDELPTPDGVGRFNHFSAPSNGSVEVASIYWTPSTGSHLIKGSIRDRWAQLGWEKSPLGYPTTEQGTAQDGVSTYQNFQQGTILQSSQYGARYVVGEIYKKWGQYGYDGGFLGKPTTDEVKTPDGAGRYTVFEGGSVYWSPASGAHSIQGAIRDRWAQLGWEQSYLGYPTSDEYNVSGGKRTDFQHGYIVWKPSTGAVDHRF